jgi:outer membrane protein OmpA-like peptidoglycan-associated protein
MGISITVRPSRVRRHSSKPVQGGRPAGHRADPGHSTPGQPSSIGIQRRVPASTALQSLRRPSGPRPVRALVATLAAGVTALGLAGCVAGASAATTRPIVIAATATANEPAPALSVADTTLLQKAAEGSSAATAYVVSPAGGQPTQFPLTPRRADGQIEYGPRRDVLLTQNISRIATQLEQQAATGPFDLLTTMVDASRATSTPGTMLLLSSGVTTAGALDLRQVGWADSPTKVATMLKQRGFLPNLAGWTVIFSGLGEAAGRQPALPLPQQTTLASYWLAICRATGASACRIDDSSRPLRSSRSTVPVPVVPVPVVQSITGPHGQQQSIVPADLLFAFNSATLLPGANTYLAPVAAQAASGRLAVSITGQASPDGGTASYNLRLSTARAQAVQARLISLGLPARQITKVNGIGTAGQSCTADGKLDETKCAQLRRVVITLTPITAAS